MLTTPKDPTNDLVRRGQAESEGLGSAPSSLQVDVNAARIMSKDSQLMKRAETQGRQYGASRGLINSTVAGEAAQAATLDYVVPMATTEANNLNSAQMNAASIAAQRAEAEADRQARMAELNTNIEAQSRENQFDRDAQLGLQDREIGANRELAEMDAQMRTNLTNLENESRERIASMDVDESRRSEAADLVSNFQGLYNDTYRDLINNPDLGADERADLMRSAGDRLNTNMQMVEGLFSIDVDWQPTGAGTAAPVEPETGGLGPTPANSVDAPLSLAEQREQARLAAQSGR